jgi:diguanylate cyclase (GGDEF)-like protein
VAAPTRVLIVDDDEDIRAYLEVTLELAKFEVLQAADGTRALEVARAERPDLIVLDVMMPGLDGLEVLRRLRADARTNHVPVILLTARVQADDTVEGLEGGADDYVTKPFDADVLVARIHSALRRADLQRARNPLTGLPGNEPIQRSLAARLAGGEPFALLYVDLDRFKPFNDHYGFLRGDDALRSLAELLRGVARDLGDEQTFIGHVGGDDFVMLVTPEQAEVMADEICARFDAHAPTLYDASDREAGYIEVADRRGVPQSYGILSLSVGIASSDRRDYAHPGEVVAVATEMKRYAKASMKPTSNWAIDRRRDDDVAIDLEVDLP